MSRLAGAHEDEFESKQKSSPFRFRKVKQDKTELEMTREFELMMGGKITDVMLSPEQLLVHDAVVKWFTKDSGQRQILTVGGYAGTGKTTLLAVLSNRFADSRVKLATFTGKASSVLRRKLRAAGVPREIEVSTLHGLMYRPIVDDATGDVTNWFRKESLDCDLVIVDEASMLNEWMFKDLTSYGLPVLAVGDHGQLPPIKGSFNLMDNPDLRLDVIHRQAADNPILKLSDFVRREGYLDRNMHESPNLCFVDFDHLVDVIDEVYGPHSKVPLNDAGLLCYSNQMRTELNWFVRNARQRFDASQHRPPVVGEQVVLLKNVEQTIFNGMRGFVQAMTELTVNHYDMRVLFPDEGIEVIGPVFKGQFDNKSTIRNFVDFAAITGQSCRSWNEVGLLFDYGYSLTCHKAQGSEWEHVILQANDFVPMQYRDPDTYRRALYTAVTRAKQYLVVLV